MYVGQWPSFGLFGIPIRPIDFYWAPKSDHLIPLEGSNRLQPGPSGRAENDPRQGGVARPQGIYCYARSTGDRETFGVGHDQSLQGFLVHPNGSDLGIQGRPLGTIRD